MPGVVVNTGVRIGGAGAEQAPSSTLFIVGIAERGRTDAHVVRSMAEFIAEYGDYTGDGKLYQHVQTFFEEGGIRAVVRRLVGTDTPATKSTANLLDGLDGAIAITLTAANPGVWGTEITAEAVNTGSEFSLTITLKGAQIFSSSGYTTSAQAIADINASIPNILVATAGASEDIPYSSDVTLTGGDAKLDDITDATVVDALEDFADEFGTGAVAAPGYYGETIWDGLLAHAVEYRRVAFAGFSAATSYSSAITAAGNYGGTSATDKSKASHLAFFWPQVVVPDGAGSTRVISPESYAAAARARQVIAVGGPWKPAAGVSSSSRYVLSLSSNGATTKVPKTISNALDEGKVNAIRVIDGQVRIYGARSASNDTANWRYITYRDTVNQIASQSEKALEQFVFSTIDSRKTLFGAIASALTSIMENVKDKGGVYAMVDAVGNNIDRGYLVDVSDALNPVTALAEGKISASIGVRVAGVADLITLTITKSSLTTAL
jgi:hypothetical protein